MQMVCREAIRLVGIAEPYRLPARQPSYTTAEERRKANEAASVSTLDKIKQKFPPLPKLLNSNSAQDSQNKRRKLRSTPTRNSNSNAKRNPLGTFRKTLGKILPFTKKSGEPSAQPDVTRGQQTQMVGSPLAKQGKTPGTDIRGSHLVVTSTLPTLQPRRRRPIQPPKPNPPIVFGSSKRLPTAGIDAKPSPQLIEFRPNIRRMPLPGDDDATTATTRQNRQPSSIEWASGVDDAPPLPIDAPKDAESADSPAPQIIDVPLNDATLDGRITISSHNGRISLTARAAPLESVLDVIAQQQGLNIVTAGSVASSVSATLTNVNLDDALNSILSVAGFTWTRQKDIIVVSPITANSGVAPSVQGRIVRVFPLNFVSATDVQQVVTGLLSPIGQVFVTESDPLDKRRTRDRLVVEDLPDYLRRVEEYVAQVDQPPRQVLIEAHILRVDLTDETRHGVDFNYLAELTNTELSLRTQGFANPAASPAFFLGIDATDVNVLVEAIKNTNDAKTLASPKVLVVNGQDARIQIGERFGFLVTTTTETSTLQNVVMTVTPQIGDDGQVLMTIRPEVSSGRININTGLPEEETTEVSTTVLLPDGHGIIIGGLIQESISDQQSKIPIFGDLWLVGKLFQRKSVVRERAEVIIALIPRIVPYGVDYDLQSEIQFTRATTPLFDGELWSTDRPWEAVMPDAIRNPRRVRVKRIPKVIPNLFDPAPNPVEYYFATQPEYDSWIPPFVSGDDVNFIEAEGLHPAPPVPSQP